MDLTRIGAMFQGLGAAANDYYKLEKQRQEMEYYDQIKQSQLESTRSLIESRQEQIKLDRQNQLKGAELMNRTAREQEMTEKSDAYTSDVYSKYVQRSQQLKSPVSQKDFQVYFMDYSRANQETPIETKNWAAKKLMKSGFAKADNPPRGPDHSYSDMLNASKAQDSFEKIYQSLYSKRNQLISAKEAAVNNPANSYVPNPLDMSTGLYGATKKAGMFVDPTTNKYIGKPAAYDAWYHTKEGAPLKEEADYLSGLLKAEIRKAQRLGNVEDAQRGTELLNGTPGKATAQPKSRSAMPNPAALQYFRSLQDQQQPTAEPDVAAPEDPAAVEMPGQAGGDSYDAKAKAQFSPEDYNKYQRHVGMGKDPQSVYDTIMMNYGQ